MKVRPGLWLGNGFLLLASMGATLVGFEVLLRIALPQKLYRYPRDLFRNDPEIGFILNPGFAGELRTPEFHTQLRISSLGFRNAELSRKPAGVYRVLIVGDSFVSALNVEAEETFVSVSGHLLDEWLGRGRVEVVNAGVPNYGTWHELRILRRFVRDLEVDAAVLCVFVGNDLEDNLRPLGVVVRDGFLVDRRPVRGLLPRPIRAWLQRHSMTYAFVWTSWHRARDLLLGRAPDPLGGLGALLKSNDDARTDSGYRESASLLREAKDFLTGYGIPLLVVIIPVELQVYPEKFDALATRMPGSEGVEGYDLARPTRRWAEIAESLGLPVVDLLPALRDRNAGPPLFMSLDGHLTVEGNRIAGEAIASGLMPLLAGAGAGP